LSTWTNAVKFCTPQFCRTEIELTYLQNNGVPPLQFRFLSLIGNFLASTAQFPFLLLSDSLSSCPAMQDPHSPNPIVQRILILLHSLPSSSSSCAFLWIPGHINLPDHDAVNFAAKQSLLFTKITDPPLSPAYDLKSYYCSFITSSWHNTGHTQPLTKLRSIKKTPTPWCSNRTAHHEEIIISRLRIGHTRLTHSYLQLGHPHVGTAMQTK